MTQVEELQVRIRNLPIVQDKNNLLKIKIKNNSYFEGSRIARLMLL